MTSLYKITRLYNLHHLHNSHNDVMTCMTSVILPADDCIGSQPICSTLILRLDRGSGHLLLRAEEDGNFFQTGISLISKPNFKVAPKKQLKKDGMLFLSFKSKATDI